MKIMWSKLIKTLQFLRGFLPKSLPVGVREFNQFCESIFTVYGLPDLPSYRHAIGTMIMHLGPVTFYKAPWFFALSVKKAMANQVAYEMLMELKEAEKKHNGEVIPEMSDHKDESLPEQGVQGTPEAVVPEA